jgi:hypothetical protein
VGRTPSSAPDPAFAAALVRLHVRRSKRRPTRASAADLGSAPLWRTISTDFRDRRLASSPCRKSEKTACSRATRPVFFESMFSSARPPLREFSTGCSQGARLPVVFEWAAGLPVVSECAAGATHPVFFESMFSSARPPPREFSTGCSQGARRPGNFQVDVDPVATLPEVSESAFSGARLPFVFVRAASDNVESSRPACGHDLLSSSNVLAGLPGVFGRAAGARFCYAKSTEPRTSVSVLCALDQV